MPANQLKVQKGSHCIFPNITLMDAFCFLCHICHSEDKPESKCFFKSLSNRVFISPMCLPFTSRRGCSRRAASKGRPAGRWVGKPESRRDNGPGSPGRWLRGRASNLPGSSQAFPAALGRETLRRGAWRPGWGWPWWKLPEPWKAKRKRRATSQPCEENGMCDIKTQNGRLTLVGGVWRRPPREPEWEPGWSLARSWWGRCSSAARPGRGRPPASAPSSPAPCPRPSAAFRKQHNPQVTKRHYN